MESLDDQLMVLSLKRKWTSMQVDAKETLRFAFQNSMLRPDMVAEYNINYSLINKKKVYIHQYRIGFAGFKIAIREEKQAVILDMLLKDGKKVYVSIKEEDSSLRDFLQN